MDALRDICKLILVLAGLITATCLIVKFGWLVLPGILLVAILLSIKYAVDDRLRE